MKNKGGMIAGALAGAVAVVVMVLKVELPQEVASQLTRDVVNHDYSMMRLAIEIAKTENLKEPFAAVIANEITGEVGERSELMNVCIMDG